MKEKNRNKEIYMSIPGGCDRESQPYEKAVETPDKNTRGWLVAGSRKWLNKVRSMLNLFQHLPLPNQIKEKPLLITISKQETLKQVQGGHRVITAKAFTLIELLVVVLIIGILAAIAVPQYTKAVEKSRLSGMLQKVPVLEQALDAYILEAGYPSDSMNTEDLWNVLGVNYSSFSDMDHGDRRCNDKLECINLSCSSEYCYIEIEEFSNWIGASSFVGAPNYYLFSQKRPGGTWTRSYSFCHNKDLSKMGLEALGYTWESC